MTAYPARPALFIDGYWLSGEGRASHQVVNPATGAVLAELPLATTADLDAALDAELQCLVIASLEMKSWYILFGAPISSENSVVA